MPVVVGEGSQMNKFEQVSSDDNHMSQAGYAQSRRVCLEGRVCWRDTLPCDLSHDACDVTYPPPPATDTLPSSNG